MAKKLYTLYDKHSNTVIYEYRGYQYEVVFANDWTFCTTPAHIQHKDAQARIDAIIADREKEHTEKPFDIDEVYMILGW